MTQSFDEWYFKQRYLGIEPIDHARAAFKAGAQSKQAEIDECKEVAESIEDAYIREKTKVDELQRKYDAMYNAFVVADDCRKEWHRCYVGIRQSEDELQKRIEQAIEQLESESEGFSGLVYNYDEALLILKGTTNEQ